MNKAIRALKEEVLHANQRIPLAGLTTLSWGNVSGIDRLSGIYVIKPSGVPYSELTEDLLVMVDVESGKILTPELRPSVDNDTHRTLYLAFESIGGITHTHSTHAVAFAQAQRELPVLGTTHADTFDGNVKCTRALTPSECATAYEENTGRVILETLDGDAESVPAILTANHGPFAWGASATASIEHAIICEAVAEIAFKTLLLNPHASAPQHLLDRHFKRKHGTTAYYGNAQIAH